MTTAISPRSSSQLQLLDELVRDYLLNIGVAGTEITALQAGGLVADLATAKALVNGTAAVGAGTKAARDNHVHPPENYGFVVPADAAASTTTAETAFARVAAGSTISAIKISPTGAVTASDTLYATITIKWRNGVGGAAATVATLITNVAGGSWTAFTTKDMGAITNGVLTAGGVLTYTIAKASSGTQLPSFVIAPVFG